VLAFGVHPVRPAPRSVEVVDPAGDNGAGVVRREEQVRVESFVAHPSLDALSNY
jgi:hypothetical protein